MTTRPHVDDAPGLTWRKTPTGWEARWRARHDLIQRGYHPKSLTVWAGAELDEAAAELIRRRCRTAQGEMLIFGRGEMPVPSKFDGTLARLIDCYQTDPDSTYQKLRTSTRRNQDAELRRLAAARGTERVEEIKARQIKRWHEEFKGTDGLRITTAHRMMALLRTVMRFGATMLEDDHCLRVASLLSQMRFQGNKPRSSAITAEQVIAIREAAHAAGRPSIALAQAFQYECTFRQKDVIGEWVPQDAKEGGLSDVLDGNEKWLRGLRWNEIDGMILRHVTSKKQKEVVVDLRLAPMVLEELQRFSEIPASGPVIVDERTGIPWRRSQFRKKWRELARKCGVPDSVFNMDSRAGAITEAILSGAPIEHVRHAATHSQVSQTAAYDRSQADATAKVMQLRAAHRNKAKTP